MQEAERHAPDGGYALSGLQFFGSPDKAQRAASGKIPVPGEP